MTLPVAILAGGLATRLRPVTERIPKSLVDVAGEPFIVRQLRYLKGQGIEGVVVCVGHLGEQIVGEVRDGSSLGIDVRYSWDGPTALGTGGALRRALPLLGSSFFVFYGDSFLPIDFGEVERTFLAEGTAALMTVLRNQNRWDRSNVEFRAPNVVAYDKRSPGVDMEYIDYGLGILTASVVRDFPQEVPFDLSDLYRALSLSGDLAGYEVHSRFYEIGSPQGLLEPIQYFEEK